MLLLLLLMCFQSGNPPSAGNSNQSLKNNTNIKSIIENKSWNKDKNKNIKQLQKQQRRRNKQTNKRTNKQTNKQTNKRKKDQTN